MQLNTFAFSESKKFDGFSSRHKIPKYDRGISMKREKFVEYIL